MSDQNSNQGVPTNPQENQPTANANTVQEAPTENNVVSLDSARAEGSAQAQARAVEIMQTCELAGFPAKAQDFIKGDLAMADIRQSLVTLKANADQVELESNSDGSLATSQPNQGGRSFGNQPPADLENSPLVKACVNLAGQFSN